MASLKTLITNVRSALQQAHTAWTLMDQHISEQQDATRVAYIKALTELRDALAITFADRKLASYFRESVKARHPHLSGLVNGYKQEMEKLQTWLKVHKEEDIQKTIEQQKKQLDLLIEDGRKAMPAMYNNLIAVEGLVREAKKEGSQPPKDTVESAPGNWLEYFETLEHQLHQLSVKSNWFTRMGGSSSGLIKEAKRIEKRSREGWPTIMLHAKQSLSLQQRVINHQQQMRSAIEESIKTLSLHGQYAERLADLHGMGEEGYILAHAQDKSATELSQCLDTSVVGDAVSLAWSVHGRMKTHENHLKAVADTLLEWTSAFTKMEKQLIVDDKRADHAKTDESCKTMHDACTCIRRTVATLQQWVNALNEAEDSTEGLMDGIFTDAHMRNLMFQNNHTVVEALRLYNKD